MEQRKKRTRPLGLIRNPKDRNLVGIVEGSRFIASSDLYLIDGRAPQVVSAALKSLRNSRQLRAVYSAQRLPGKHGFFARKTYIYAATKTPQGHIKHWLHVAHLRALFTKAARELDLELNWSQSKKHRNLIPDFTVRVAGMMFNGEVDNSTERMRMDRIAGKPLNDNTLIVCFKSRARMDNISDKLPGLHTYHGLFHHLEPDFNILTAPIWWDGDGWRALIKP